MLPRRPAYPARTAPAALVLAAVVLTAFVAAALAAGCSGPPTATPTDSPTPTFAPTATTLPLGSRAVFPGPGAQGCVATSDDGSGPNYEPGAPERDSVGTGYVLSGTVLEETTCKPISGATVELWMAGPEGVYGPDWRATIHADEAGHFGFESHPPIAYGGGDAHIHVRVSSPGHRELFLVHVPEEGAQSAELAIVLSPE